MRLTSVVIGCAMTCLLNAFFADSVAENAELAVLRTKFEQEVANVLKPVEKRYLGRLETLHKELVRKKDLDGANSVKAAINELKANPTSTQLGGTIEGSWIVKYSNGHTRSYVVSEAGVVQFVDVQKTGKVSWDRDAWLFEFEDGKLERLRVQRMLNVEHYTSRADFERQMPSITGTGTKQ